MAEADEVKRPPFELFRASDAVDYTQEGPMTGTPMSDVEATGFQKLMEGGFLEGSHLKLLYSRPGMSLTYVWFKSGYPLPLHSHSADCLYFIVSGSLKIGNEELGPGDGFFLGTDVPYAYIPGENGVEVLEFRTSNSFDFRSRAKGEAYWQKLAADLVTAREHWPEEKAPPSGITVG